MKYPLAFSVALALFAVTGTVRAQDAASQALTPEQQQAMQQMQAFWDSLDRRSGTIALGDDLATLNLPDDFYWLNRQDAIRVLVDVWGNPPEQNESLFGMLFPAKYTPFDEDSWAVTIEYVEDGHVSDSDAADIDFDGLLADMQREVRAANGDRTAAGYEPIELLGWAEPPHYNTGSHKLYWAKELRFGDSPFTTLNYEIRALGRKGFLSMTFVAATEQLAEINQSRETVLSMASFNAGQRYDDFDSNIDEIAAYGIGALIAGKVAAKAGLLAGGLLLLKKLGVILFLAFAAVGRKLKSMFARAT